MKQYFDLTGRVAIVTGCSGGLGVQMAKALANQGCNIVPVARRLEKLEEVAKEITEEFGVECLPLRLDITDTISPTNSSAARWRSTSSARSKSPALSRRSP